MDNLCYNKTLSSKIFSEKRQKVSCLLHISKIYFSAVSAKLWKLQKRIFHVGRPSILYKFYIKYQLRTSFFNKVADLWRFWILYLIKINCLYQELMFIKYEKVKVIERGNLYFEIFFDNPFCLVCIQNYVAYKTMLRMYYLHVCLPIKLAIYLYLGLIVYLSISLSTCLFACQCSLSI